MTENLNEAGKPAAKKWTLMIYFSGDNDLSEDIAAKVLEIREFFSNNPQFKNIGLTVYFDGGNPMVSTQLINFTNAETSAASQFPNAANPDSVTDFVDWTINHQGLQAERYALFFCGHGDGFQRTSFMRDMSSFDFMTVKKLSETLLKLKNSHFNNKNLDLLVFDSCVMSLVEIVNELTETADIFVGSEGYMPTRGFSYQRLLGELQKLDSNSAIQPNEISSAVISSTIANNRQFSQFQFRSLDVHALDLTDNKFSDVVDAINDLASLLEQSLSFVEPISAENYLRVESLKDVLLACHWNAQTFLFEQAIDLIDFCRHLRSGCFSKMFETDILLRLSGAELLTIISDSDDPTKILSVELKEDISPEDRIKYQSVIKYLENLAEICEACKKTVETMHDCILQSCYSGPDYQYSRGIALFFPWSLSTFSMTEKVYLEYSFACRNEKPNQLNPWYSFLKRYLTITLQPTADALKVKKLNTFNYIFHPKFTEMMVEANIELDPPPKGLIASENQYKEYFMRIKNFPIKDINGCSAPVSDDSPSFE